MYVYPLEVRSLTWNTKVLFLILGAVVHMVVREGGYRLAASPYNADALNALCCKSVEPRSYALSTLGVMDKPYGLSRSRSLLRLVVCPLVLLASCCPVRLLRGSSSPTGRLEVVLADGSHAVMFLHCFPGLQKNWWHNRRLGKGGVSAVCRRGESICVLGRVFKAVREAGAVHDARSRGSSVAWQIILSHVSLSGSLVRLPRGCEESQPQLWR